MPKTTNETKEQSLVKDMVCWNCENKSQYKCPKSLLRYCGIDCYKKLRQDMESGAIKPAQQESPMESDVAIPVKADGGTTLGTDAATSVDTWQKYDNEDDRLPQGKLDLLANSEEIKKLLTNPHLRRMLKFIDSSEDKEKGIESAMKEPIFTEFADACLALVESDSGKSPEPQEEVVEVKEFELLQF